MPKEEYEIVIKDGTVSEFNLKNINIRSVDSTSYQIFSQAMKARGYSIGEAFNIVIKDVISNLSQNQTGVPAISQNIFQSSTSIRIENLSAFEVNEIDLIEGEEICIFQNIENLKFTKDITKETFLKYVHLISDCKSVKIPNTIPKLRIHSIVKNCEKIIIYETD